MAARECHQGRRVYPCQPVSAPSASHESWLVEKRAAGWKYGPVKDAEAWTHPCVVPYDDLPQEQRAKDYLFQAVVRSAADLAGAFAALREPAA